MFKIWEATNFRRSVAGLCLILAPIAFAAAEIVGPETSGGPSSQLATFAANRGALLASVLFGLASSVLFIPALFGLLQQIRGRATVVSHIAAALIVYAIIANTALWGVNLMFWEMAKPGLDRSAMVALLDGLQHEPIGAVVLAGHYLLALGMILLGIGVWRSGIAPRWIGLLAILYPLTDILFGFTPFDGFVADLVSNACGIVGFAALGLRLLAAPDSSWEPAPAVEPRVAEPVTV